MKYDEIPLGVVVASDTLDMVIVRLHLQQWAVQIGGSDPGRIFWPNEIEDVHDWEVSDEDNHTRQPA